MRVRDNGRGIEADVLKAGRKGHWGLAGMRGRAARIGGFLEIFSTVNNGTEGSIFYSRRHCFPARGCGAHTVNSLPSLWKRWKGPGHIQYTLMFQFHRESANRFRNHCS